MVIGKSKFLIAEAGINHGGKIHKAYKLIDEAKKQEQTQLNSKLMLLKKE